MNPPPTPIARVPLKVAALLVLVSLTGCTTALHLASQVPTTVETLEGNFRTLAACTSQRLAQRQVRVQRSDPDQATARLAADEWQMSFVNDEGGRLTRVEMTSPGTQGSDYALALARACAA